MCSDTLREPAVSVASLCLFLNPSGAQHTLSERLTHQGACNAVLLQVGVE
jgi:hypothetical protein